MKSNSKNFERVDNRGGQLENCFHQRERERENRRPCSKYIVAMLKFRLQLSSSFPLSHKIAPQIRLSFHTRISTPICHACIEATYLYTSLRIVIMERTRSTTKTTVPGMIDFSKGQLVSTRHQSSSMCTLSSAMTKFTFPFFFYSLYPFIANDSIIEFHSLFHRLFF